MAAFSSNVMNYARIAFYTVVSYLMFTDPKSVLEYKGVIILASSMHLPILLVIEGSPVYGCIALLLAVLTVNDLVPLLDGNVAYFEAVLPTRLLCYFALAFYCYFGSNVFLCNSLAFSFIFMEIWFSILIFSGLRDEKMARLRAEEQKALDLKSKFERGELNEKEAEAVSKEMENAEIQKIMSEFQ